MPTTSFTLQQKLILAATILASAMAFIDGTIVNIALPVIQEDLQAEFDLLQWIVNAYMLTLGSLILVGGAAGDLFGRKRIFMTGMWLFTIASIACALAPDGLYLAIARAFQGIGAALVTPQSLAIITAAFPEQIRGKAIGIWAGAGAITTSLGPPLGGILIEWFDWRAIFWLNLPLAAVIWLISRKAVPESRNEHAHKIDWPGAIMVLAALGLLTWGLIEQGRTGLPFMGLGVAGLVLFLHHQTRHPDPLMPLWLWRLPGFAAANIVTLLIYGSLAGMLFLLPFELITRRGFGPAETGMILLPLGLVIGLISAKAGKWTDQAGPRPLLIGGSFLMAMAAAVFSLTIPDFWVGIMLPLMLVAVGMGLVAAPLSIAVMNAASHHQAGIASGINNAISRIAGLLAVAIMGSLATLVFAGQSDTGLPFGQLPALDDPARPAAEAAFLTAWSITATLAACWGLLSALVAALWLPKASGQDGSRQS